MQMHCLKEVHHFLMRLQITQKYKAAIFKYIPPDFFMSIFIPLQTIPFVQYDICTTAYV